MVIPIFRDRIFSFKDYSVVKIEQSKNHQLHRLIFVNAIYDHSCQLKGRIARKCLRVRDKAVKMELQRDKQLSLKCGYRGGRVIKNLKKIGDVIYGWSYSVIRQAFKRLPEFSTTINRKYKSGEDTIVFHFQDSQVKLIWHF